MIYFFGLCVCKCIYIKAHYVYTNVYIKKQNNQKDQLL